MDHQPIAWTENSNGVGVLTAAKPRVDGGQDGARIWELTFLVDLKAREQVERLKLHHGGLQAFQLAADEAASSDLKIRPLKDQLIHLDLGAVPADGSDPVEVVKDVAAEVRFMKLKLQPTVQVQVARVNLRGVPVDHSNAIVGLLGRTVHVTVRQDQQPLFGEVGDDTAPETGQLVGGKMANGDSVVGLMVREDKGRVIVDDFGVLLTIEQVATALWVESVDDLQVDEHLAAYEQTINDMDARPSWAQIVEAQALAWTAEEVAKPTGQTCYVNAAVFERAAAMVAEGQEVPEAGEKPKRRRGKATK